MSVSKFKMGRMDNVFRNRKTDRHSDIDVDKGEREGEIERERTTPQGSLILQETILNN